MNDIYNRNNYKSDKYYSKNARGKIQVWSIEVIENDFDAKTIILTGELDGTIRNIDKLTSEGKNVGKSNYTSPYQQAVKEANAKERVKIKHGYKTLIDIGAESESILSFVLALSKMDANNNLKPMKAVKFKKGLMNYPCLLQPKINGVRATYQLISGQIGEGVFAKKIQEPKLLSKEGHEYIIPHIRSSIDLSLFQKNNIIFDGELYVHNEILSNIRRRLSLVNARGTASRNSLSMDVVKYYIFDLSIPDMSQLNRIAYKDELLKYNANVLLYLSEVNRFGIRGDLNIPLVNVSSILVHSDEEVYKYLEAALKSGFEGVIIRDMDAEYMFGGRRVNMSKLKNYMVNEYKLSGEFKLLDTIKKNEDSNRTYIAFVLQNDTNDRTFEVTPNGDEEDRLKLLNNAEVNVGKYVTITYGERTINDIPFHITDVAIREEWDLDINDLNKED